MSLIILAIVASLISISTSLQQSTTTSCNYAVDLWWLTANPPSLSPTPAPTDDPTKSPTPEPTSVNETKTPTYTPDERETLMSASSESGASLVLLNPYKMDQCYSMNFTEEPFNQVSWRYSCKDASTLRREIFWDSLQCDGADIDITEITEQERGLSTQFICNQANDCATAHITVKPAITMSPTPQPTDSPSDAPTREPTQLNEISCRVFGCGTYDANRQCNCEQQCEWDGDCCQDYVERCENDRVENAQSNSGSVSGGDYCTSDLGANPTAQISFEWTYATNICLHARDLYGLFRDDDDDTPVEELQGNIGWQCVDNNYYMAVFNGTDCGSNPKKYIQYRNDACVFGDASWAFVDCSENYVAPTPTSPPNNRPTRQAGDTGCVDAGCNDNENEICIVGTGECESAIVQNNCQNDDACDGDHKCNVEGGFCYLSPCENTADCVVTASADTYTCNRKQGMYDTIEYEYKICEVVRVDTTGGVQRNAVLMGVVCVLGLITSM